ncbi:phage tail protein [Streptomyces vinaceus]|uniref:phage tail protein n=1 Tax=Streptomyces vinaceus TaxID=1960 RepID=UPI0037F9A6C7
MRGTVPGLPTPYPIGSLLPAVYREDPFAQRFTQGLDEVLAPAISTLDCLDAYLDASLAPEDFLDWLASWVGLVLRENLSADRRRMLLKEAYVLFRDRGTARAMRRFLELMFDAQVEVRDSGTVAAARTAGGSGKVGLSGASVPTVSVRITGTDLRTGDVERAVAQLKPAHVLHTVEVVNR